MKLLKRFSVMILCFVLLAVCMLTGCEQNTKGDSYRIGTGGTGGNYFGYGTHLSELVAENSEYTLTVTETAGSKANVRLISQGYVDFAMVQSDVLSASIAEGLTGYHAVTGLYNEGLQIVVAADSDIHTVEDLKGKRVSLGEKDSGAFSNAQAVLKLYGLDESQLEVSNLSYADAATQLSEQKIDAFFCLASAPTTAIVSLSETMDLRVFGISEEVILRLISENDAYVKNVIPANTYKGQTEELITIGVTAVLVAADSVSEEVENTVLDILQKNNEMLQEISFGFPIEVSDSGIYNLSVNMYLTLAIAVLVLFLGMFLRKKIAFLETFCIPAPVIGGLIFAIVSCILYVTGVVEFQFDETLKNVCMIMFFTSVGFQANLKVLKKGGISLIIFLVCVVVLIFCQNGLSVGLSRILNISPYIGLCTGSIPMVGGHGTAGAFGQVLEDLGLSGATTLCTAAATFGLVVGSLMGGPIGRRLILKHDLMNKGKTEDVSVLIEDEKKHHRKASMYAPAAYQIAIAMGIGTIISQLLSLTGMTFPVYIGAMIVAAIIRNVGEYSGKFTVHMGEINDIGGICLSLFLGIAMVTLKLWQLADLALPLFALLAAQSIFMFIFARFVVFNVMGRNYDSAVLAAGTCGFGMGATPNAMANMQALTEKFGASVQAYILVPIVGSMFADFINSLVVTFFINIV